MTAFQKDMWTVDPGQYPADGSLAERLAFCLRYAVLAPSAHNSQPWFFAVRPDAIDVYADRTRALPVVDPQDRELTIGCGAALGTLEVALTRFGLRHETRTLPEGAHVDHVARVHVTSTGAPLSDDPLFDAITKRHTNRTSYREDPVAREIAISLETEALDDEVWFALVHDLDTRLAVADLVEEGDRDQMQDSSFRRELASWMHPNRSRARDGMPGYAYALNDALSSITPLVVRTFDVGEQQAATDRALALKSPLLGVIGTKDDSPRSWVRSGRTLARVLLRATASGLSASFLNQPIEVSELRGRLATSLGRSGYPQLLLRMGVAEPARPTPRRSLEEVLVSVD
jgi:hypothetical protein